MTELPQPNVRGRMLHAIKGLYDVGVYMHIKTPAGTLDPIHTSGRQAGVSAVT
jgi:hypothetical protein